MALAYTNHRRRPGERPTSVREPTPAYGADPAARTGRSHLRRTTVVGVAAATGIARTAPPDWAR